MIQLNAAPVSNILGGVALLCYSITLLPTILRVVFPKFKQTGIPKLLLKHRRTVGILAFIFALAHGYLLIKKRNIDWLDINTSWIYIQGVATFTIFTLLAITSNDWSVKKLKKNWKRLHQLTYWCMFLLVWHVWEKMAGHWTYVTLASSISLPTLSVLFLIRRWKERSRKK